jgi:hypothetical protein
LDVVILSERDGHDRLAASVRALGEAALHDEIRSQDIDMNFMDRHLSGIDSIRSDVPSTVMAWSTPVEEQEILTIHTFHL